MSLLRKVLPLLLVALTLCACFIVPSTATFAETVGVGQSDNMSNTGETVLRVQIRLCELDYLYFKPTGSFKGMTRDAIITFQKYSAISPDGVAGEQTQETLFSARAARASIPIDLHLPIGPSLNGTPAVTGKRISWLELKDDLEVGKSYTIMDYNTGRSFHMTFTGGTAHAEMECTTAEDMVVFLEVFGNVVNYSKRPVVIHVNNNDVAASLFGFPHGTSTISDNNMDGHTCLYFDDSTSHVGNFADIEHKKQIYIASGS